VSEKANQQSGWVSYNPLNATYETKDGTVVAAELVDNVQCLADVFHIASIRAAQRSKMAGNAEGKS